MASHTLTRLQAPRRQKRQYEWAKSLVGDLLAFLVALGSCATLKLIGDIPLCEIILIPLLPLLLVVNRHRLNLRKRTFGVILTMAVVWLFGQIATDIYRSSASRDWMRGNASILFFILDMIALSLLLKGNVRRQMVFYLGLAIGIGLTPKLNPGFSEMDSYKFAYSWSIMYVVTLISCYFYKRRQYLTVGLLFSALIVVNMLFNFRSPILILFITACLILPVIPERIARIRILPPARSQARVYAVIGIALVSGAIMGKAMSFIAGSGALGPAAQAKNRDQTVAGWGLLIGGRPEILVSSRAVMDSPILGHGSWAKEPKYVEMLADVEAEYGMRPTEEGERFGGIIPAHSYLMGSWVNAGILGAVFWVYLLTLTAKSLVQSAMLQVPVTPVYCFLMVRLIWDLLFSPFGSSARVQTSFYIVIVCDLLDPDSKITKTVVPMFKRVQVQMRTRNLGRVPGRLSANF